jgi:hypothetical protein
MAPGPKILCQPITVLWSDGESPKPPPPGRKVAPGSQKDIDWRRKLGHWVGTGFDSKNEYGGNSYFAFDFAASDITQRCSLYYLNSPRATSYGTTRGPVLSLITQLKRSFRMRIYTATTLMIAGS